MDTIAAEAVPTLYTFVRRHKVLHMVRHAQGVHNLESEKSRDPLTSFEYFDAQLSSLGWQQVRDQRKDVCERGLLEKIEVVITSPMTRTLQTAVGIFRGEELPAGGFNDVTPFEEVDEKNDEVPTFKFNRIPIIAYEVCRERLGKYECDKRRTISQYRSHFPAVDFSLVENEDDILWKPDERESHEEVTARALKFINWLWGRKEKEIALVSHGVFLQDAMIELFKRNKCYPLMEGDDPYSRFENCEIRSMIIFYDSVMGLGSDSLATNNVYCGRIPHGVEALQRDSVKDKVPIEEVTTNKFPDSTLTVRS